MKQIETIMRGAMLAFILTACSVSVVDADNTPEEPETVLTPGVNPVLGDHVIVCRVFPDAAMRHYTGNQLCIEYDKARKIGRSVQWHILTDEQVI